MDKKKLLLLLLLLTVGYAHAQLSIDVETGIAVNTRNAVRYPNSSTTLSTLTDVPTALGNATTFFYRLRASATIWDRHTISALFAPLTFESKGTFTNPVTFGDYTFNTNEETTVFYKFNSYRLTYRYLLIRGEKVKFGLGLTAKIRDARIAYSSKQKGDETTDLGFVPLINFRFELHPAERWQICIDGDALVGTLGRAEDIFAGVQYAFSDLLSLKAGYRILEGGADVSQVYIFSLIHYTAFGAILTY